VRYFLNSDIIDTVFPSEGSPTWKAVEYGLDHVKKGIVWKIGSGMKVQIWCDHWIKGAFQAWLGVPGLVGCLN
jgi:hypothetical protein